MASGLKEQAPHCDLERNAKHSDGQTKEHGIIKDDINSNKNLFLAYSWRIGAFSPDLIFKFFYFVRLRRSLHEIRESLHFFAYEMLWEWGSDLECGANWSQQVEDRDSEAKWGQVEIRNRKKGRKLTWLCSKGEIIVLCHLLFPRYCSVKRAVTSPLHMISWGNGDWLDAPAYCSDAKTSLLNSNKRRRLNKSESEKWLGRCGQHGLSNFQQELETF